MIHILIGTRAQLIKMVPVMHQLGQQGIPYNFVFLAQHKETIYEILEQFALKKPDYVITDTGTDIVKTGQMIAWSIKTLIYGLLFRRRIFKNDRNGIVLIHGDAPPLLLGALMARAQGLKVGAVESGLRSFNLFKPFPEEVTRVLTARLGLIDYFFCQDDAAMTNVKQYRGKAIHTNGNTIYDMLLMAGKFNSPEKPAVDYAVVTLHRFETLLNLKRMLVVVDKLAVISKSIKLLFILHPPTRTALQKHKLYGRLERMENIELLPRMDFLRFNQCIRNSQFIISDGGSNQEESAYLGIPCLLFRNESERSEGLAKNVVLSKFDDRIIGDFVKNYRNYRVKTELHGKLPSEVILDSVRQYV